MWRKFLAGVICVTLMLGALVGQAQAQVTLPEVTVTEVVDLASIATAVATLGGAALVLAFGVGLGFVVARKAYRWFRSAM
jgi:ABC-type dipeptide/oligopeptide/nickel transport system permease component